MIEKLRMNVQARNEYRSGEKVNKIRNPKELDTIA